ncbi:MAG: sigma-70 family RNA polymerase sigma factor [Verrucomicrobiota bacterium]
MPDAEAQNGRRGVFATTHWSIVLSAGTEENTAAMAAWEKLANTYWFPVYAHVRRRVSCPEQAKDLVQEFFTTLIRRKSLARVAPEKGRFRTFLLSSLKYFLSDQYDRSSAAKRGGGLPTISFDAMAAEERCRYEQIETDSPDKMFDRCWAAALIGRALQALRSEQSQAGRGHQFEQLQEFLGREVEPGEYETVAGKLGLTPNTVAANVRRLRLRLRELAVSEAAKTTTTLSEAEDELRALFG